MPAGVGAGDGVRYAEPDSDTRNHDEYSPQLRM